MDVTPFLQVLKSFGISLSAGAFLDFLKQYFSTRTTDSVDDFAEQLQPFLQVHGANVQASTVIDMFADQGLLSIKGSRLFAPEQIAMGAGPGAQFQFGHDSRSETDKTAIEAQGNAQIVGSNAAIVQNPDGSISFKVGKKNP